MLQSDSEDEVIESRATSPAISRRPSRTSLIDDEQIPQLGSRHLLFDAQNLLSAHSRPTGKQTAIKWITQYATYPIKSVLRDIQTFVFFKEKGTANVTQAAVHLPLTLASGIFGGYLPQIWPSLSQNISELTLTTLGFLGEGFAGAAAHVANVLIVAGLGAKIGDILLSYIFNKILNKPHSVLYFSNAQIKSLLEQSGLDTPSSEQIEEVRALIHFLEGLYIKNQSKYQDFEHRREGKKILRVAENLRLGQFKHLEKLIGQIKAKDLIALNYEPNNTENLLESNTANEALEVIKRLKQPLHLSV